ERLRDLASDQRLLIFYEAPHRLVASLRDMQTAFGDRPAVVARELTKIHEEFRRASVAQLADHFTTTPPRGEVVILVSPAAETTTAEGPDVHALLKQYLLV